MSVILLRFIELSMTVLSHLTFPIQKAMLLLRRYTTILRAINCTVSETTTIILQ
jgi:hypothetical protein